MQKLFYVSMIIIVTSISLQAKSLYIQVASLYKKENLFTLSYKLNKLGYKTNISEKDGFYKVYTGPFEDEYDANSALREIQKKIAKDAFVVEVKLNGNKLVVSEDIKKIENDKVAKKEQAKKKEAQKDNRVEVQIINGTVVTEENKKETKQRTNSNNNFFVGLSAGASKFELDRKNITMSSVAYTYGVAVGYYFTNNIYMTLNYDRSTLSTAYLDTFSTSINYKLDPVFLVSPYIGLIGGMNSLNWENSSYKDNQESAFVPGIKLGAEIAISDNATLILFGRYMMLDYTAVSESSNQRTVEFSNEISGNVGVRYNF